MVKLLLNAGAKVICSRWEGLVLKGKGTSAFHTACAHGNSSIVKLFLSMKVDYNETDYYGKVKKKKIFLKFFFI
jgi:ankyrin repeat protein